MAGIEQTASQAPSMLHKHKVWIVRQRASTDGFLPHRTQSSGCHPGSAAGCRARARRLGRSPTGTWLPVSSTQPLHAIAGTYVATCRHKGNLYDPQADERRNHCRIQRLPHTRVERLHQAQAAHNAWPLLTLRPAHCYPNDNLPTSSAVMRTIPLCLRTWVPGYT